MMQGEEGLRVDWRVVEESMTAVIVDADDEIHSFPAWAPMPGSQEAFLECPVFEVLYEGTRGPGKTDALLMDFAQHVDCGFGADWRGILFRKTYKQLTDVVAKSKKWFKRIFPHATFNESTMTWKWPTGEELLLRYMERSSDYDNYHGHAYPWVGFEELTTWNSPDCYTVMMSCCRSTRPGMPRKYRATTNPYGIGHNWVKTRFHLPIPETRRCGAVIPGEGETQRERMANARCAIRGRLRENIVLLHADPDYENKLRQAARNPSELAAWIDGSWDITAGGMVDDIWDAKHNVVEPFPIPASWRIDRSFDWGSSKPWSCGWWAESDGSVVQLPNGKTLHSVRGDLYRVAELYGWTGTPNEGKKMTAREVARNILAAEKKIFPNRTVKPGPADSSIFSVENNMSIGDDMAKEKVRWTASDKRPGSRKNGWEKLRTLIKAALPYVMDHEGEKVERTTPREDPGIFVFTTCRQFIRTVPVLPRDDKDIDDVDTDSEDHIADEVRYRIYNKKSGASRKGIRGR